MDDFVYEISRNGGGTWIPVSRSRVRDAIAADPALGPEQVDELLLEMELYRLQPMLNGAHYRACPVAPFPKNRRARRLLWLSCRATLLAFRCSPRRRQQLLDLARRVDLALRRELGQ